jgi:glycopeptide antibiotics resistance protein
MFLYVVAVVTLLIVPLGEVHQEVNQSHVIGIRGDYWIHLLLFIPWAAFYTVVSNRMTFGKWVALGILMSAGMEVMQGFVPYRTFNVMDMIGNVLGIVLGGLLRLSLISTRRK